MNSELEKEIVSKFIAPNRKDRFLWNLGSPKRRNKIFDDLRDTRHFKEGLCNEVDGPEEVLKHLGVNSGEIYVISSETKYDGKQVDLRELEKIEFWEAEEIIGYDSKSKKGFFVNHESWFFTIG